MENTREASLGWTAVSQGECGTQVKVERKGQILEGPEKPWNKLGFHSNYHKNHQMILRRVDITQFMFLKRSH